jgi:hypothetical protein
MSDHEAGSPAQPPKKSKGAKKNPADAKGKAADPAPPPRPQPRRTTGANARGRGGGPDRNTERVGSGLSIRIVPPGEGPATTTGPNAAKNKSKSASNASGSASNASSDALNAASNASEAAAPGELAFTLNLSSHSPK